MERAVFINYRGEDSHSYGALLYRDLTGHFGGDLVFLDAESIPAGADFVEELLGRVRSARVLLAVIGSHWLTAADSGGRRRIDDPGDWIRRELVEAFAAGVTVIPVLTDHAELPRAADLPADITALSRCQYRYLRRREPTSDLARIVADLASLDPVLAAAARDRDNAPRQLPAAPGLFTGRAAELAALTGAATPGTVLISAIGGAGGIGKTALALYWAHQHVHRFPDGQLYVNLRGFDPTGQPVPPGVAVRGFLDALGADPSTLPVELDAQAARYRSLLAGKKMLILLDNAANVDQVIPLLPGSPTCTVLITSRHQLAGLAATHGADLLDLDVLPDHDAHDLLARHLGAERLAGEPDTVDELLALCAGLPLALSIAAARVRQHPNFPLVVLAEELRNENDRLDALDAGDLHANLRAVLSWSYHALAADTAHMFALLGLAPGPDISLFAAASLAALPLGRTRTLLRRLEHASLVQQHIPGRYRLHDLIRLYATGTVDQLDADVRADALRRVVDCYRCTAHDADRLLEPNRLAIRFDPPVPGCLPDPLPDHAAALAWFDTEHECLLAAQHIAATQGWHQIVWELAWNLDTFHYRRGHLHDDLAVWQAAVAAAEHLTDPTARTLAHRFLGTACAGLGRHAEAIERLHQALNLAEHHTDPTHQAQTHHDLAWAWEQLGDDEQALRHATHALTVYRAIANRTGEAHTLNAVGRYAARLGDYDQARTHCQAALVLHRRDHNLDGEATTLDSLAYLEHHTGHHHQAVDHYRRAVALRRDFGNTYEVTHALDGLGHSHVALGQTDQARTAWQEALQLYQEQGRGTDAARVQKQLDLLDQRLDIG